MGLFGKKKEKVSVELKCPAKDCIFICDDKTTMDRHVEWKHPELKLGSNLPK
jgi:hypothetical protein